MGAAQEIMAELEAIGVLGSARKVALPKSVSSESVVPVSAPEPEVEDGLRKAVMEHCERAVDLLEKSIEAQMELREVFVALHNLAAGESVEEVPESSDEEDEPLPTDEEEEAEQTEEAEEETLDAVPAAPEPTVVKEVPIVRLVDEEPEEAPLLQESQTSELDTGNPIQDLIAANDLATRALNAPRGQVLEPAGPPPRSISEALTSVPMPEARRRFLAEMKAEAEGRTKKNRAPL